MSIVSLSFMTFLAVVAILYYAIPKRYQWILLLAASCVFYLSLTPKGAVYVLVTVSTIYFGTNWMQQLLERQKTYIKENRETLSKDQKKEYKERIHKQRKRIMLLVLLINIGLLCVFKYLHFAIDQYNSIALFFGSPKIDNSFKLIVPLGISFYTFQSVGYLLDVYWEKQSAEKNYFKVMLFITFFPQITQGPISQFDQLSSQLFSEHSFEYHHFAYGVQRILWGYMKKMVIADTLAPYVKDLFQNYSSYSGISVFIGAFFYSIQIYADFSGYMDIMCGFCQVLGIQLTENFERPYFSKSVTEYWRRWHISLGAWFKNYIYYAIGMSNWNRQLAFKVKRRFGKRLAYTIPATVALIIVWLATGAWHGASWAYIVWGLLNGLFIILSIWMEPVYVRWKSALKVNEEAWKWRAFQTIRTFILITFIKVLPEVGTLSEGLGLWKHVFVNHVIPGSFSELFAYVDLSYNFAVMRFGTAILCTILLFFSSLMQRKKPIRDYYHALPFVVRITGLVALAFIIILFGVQSSWGEGGFLYANF